MSPVNVRDASEIDRAATAFVQTPNGGLIVTGTPLAQLHRDLIISLAAKHRLPAVYFERFFVTDGGLISYGADFVDQYRRAVGMSTVSSMAINRPICRCRLRTNMNLSSI